MKTERYVSLSVVLFLGLWTVCPGGAVAIPSLLPIQSVIASEAVGSQNPLPITPCEYINAIGSANCPQIKKPACCTNTKLACTAGKTNQTNTSMCSTGTTEICQDVEGCCGAGYNQTASQGNCTQVTVLE